MTVYLSSFSLTKHPDLQKFVAKPQPKPLAYRDPPFIEKERHKAHSLPVNLTDSIVIGQDKK